MELDGWVNNTARGVFVEVEGAREKLDQFLLRVEREKPAISFIQSLESSFADPVGYAGFEIRKSEGGEKTALVHARYCDLSGVPRRNSSIRGNRRFGYPFTNCTNCGPRYTHHRVAALRPAAHDDAEIHHVRGVRARVSATRRTAGFTLSPTLARSAGRNWSSGAWRAQVLARRAAALDEAAEAIREGRIVGVKGLGGFHLMADARNEDAVARLRERKHREEKPFALMFPSAEELVRECALTPLELRLLRSPESPIVLVRRRQPVASALAARLRRAIRCWARCFPIRRCTIC